MQAGYCPGLERKSSTDAGPRLCERGRHMRPVSGTSPAMLDDREPLRELCCPMDIALGACDVTGSDVACLPLRQDAPVATYGLDAKHMVGLGSGTRVKVGVRQDHCSGEHRVGRKACL